MICWYCYYGWPRLIRDIYDKYINVAGESAMHYGAAHIVWDDENFERHHIQWCLDNFEKYKHDEASDDENLAVKQSLIDMLALPDEILEAEPRDYDGIHPENYPPTVEMSSKK